MTHITQENIAKKFNHFAESLPNPFPDIAPCLKKYFIQDGLQMVSVITSHNHTAIYERRRQLKADIALSAYEISQKQ